MRTASQSGRFTLTRLEMATKTIGPTTIPIPRDKKQLMIASTSPGKTTTVTTNETIPILDSLLLRGYDQQDNSALWIWLRIIQNADALVGGSG